jgi:hypothetical protein
MISPTDCFVDLAGLRNGPRDGPPVILLHGFPEAASIRLEVSTLSTRHEYRPS